MTGKGPETKKRRRGGGRRDVQTVGLTAGEEGDGAYWRAMIYNDTGDPG